MRRSCLKALCTISLVLAGCDDLVEFEELTCGNSVIDDGEGEECDSHDHLGMACGSPDDDQRRCRFTCTATPCAPGWGCGRDGICRAPTEAFEQKGPVISAGAAWIAAADLDGDGQMDVLEGDSFASAVHYLGAELSEQKAVTFPTAGAQPSLGDLTDDGLPDIVTTAPNGGGVVVVRAQGDRTLLQTAYSAFDIADDDGDGDVSQTHIFAVEANPKKPGQEPGAVGTLDDTPASGTPGVFALPFEEDVEPFVYVMDFPYVELADLAVGDLDQSVPCDELVFAEMGTSFVQILHVCRNSGADTVLNEQSKSDFMPPDAVTLPAGTVMSKRMTLFDVDGDQLLDLVLGVHDGTAERVAVAYGLGTGAFHSMPFASPPTTPDASASIYSRFPYFPLAIGHLDDDGIPDYVTSCWICPSSGYDGFGAGCLADPAGADPCSEYEAPPVQGDENAWKQAAIGDMNDNGIGDVAAVSQFQPLLHFFSGAGKGAFNVFAIPTEAPVGLFTQGDFDGDLLTDIAISRAEGPNDSLAILFGRRDIDPTPPVTIGRLGRILELAPAYLRSTAEYADAISDLGALTQNTPEGGGPSVFSVSLLQGRTDRQIYAPHGFSYDKGPDMGFQATVDPTQAVAVGRFTLDDEHLDVAALTGEGNGDWGTVSDSVVAEGFRLYMVPARHEAELDRGQQRAIDAMADGVVPGETLAIGANLDRDPGGFQELVLIHRRDATPGGDDPGAGTLVVAAAEVDPMGGHRWTTRSTLDFEHVIQPWIDVVASPGAELAESIANRLVLADIDGDTPPKATPEDPDLPDLDVAALATLRGVEGASIGILVFLNEDDDPTRFQPPIVLVPPEGLLLGFTFLQTDRDPEQEIVAFTTAGVYIAQFDHSSPGQWERDVTLSAREPRPRALASADMDRDGVADLLVARGPSIEIYRTKPEKE